ncbi:carboxyvinyl-carboxyphosphonate phosphorylmutase [Bradyrhizobium sp. LTSPM299]|uniref:isocitrate lyase/PEP mutase family protein n=1 Tax=Bradyrhizobium sp. LTSPM299 TaxID=1619233 RepID=UPI0005CAE082|nr:isocitrate lyase/phosphoenolpyruvate mutase family protein [Bradyrhizobium sp. LTSPM299]KJC55701.1 carboxyvinyl-carboxyphosphonate phosphorylmutase [Bradyrhizobium sp. LTSPM299]
MAREHIQVLRKMLQSDRGVILPGAPNALAARVVADLGFSAVYLTGAGLTNTLLGLPDLGFLDLSQVTEHTMAIRGVVDLPLVVDADTGFGNALNVSHTVRALERAGASAVQLEDQCAPKRCGHFDGKELIVADEMVSKIKAAVDSRREDVVVIARTDACAVEGFEAAIERAGRYIDAGADMTFVEAPNSLEELKEIPKRLRAPQLLNIVLGGKTPIVDRKSCEDMGYSFVLYANAALQGMLLGMRTALRTLREKGVLDERDSCIASFAERQRLVGKEEFDEMARSYAHLSIT